ncbi:glycerol kinase GlpK [Roseococcus sp. SDR]|uniref:glycerol kinase GlpK n=1 Tax=Roseococcus sp. SDR TaxID=2835532 RepID=UPI001BCD6D5C|nr:glycerol kinase GlpK [Roseococcus sp. SDR]MBS7788456.1 glycerol kinase GlpK [Roseococcus sp. SDR]MBV1843770.1 glycerol kinase GlpK [Roseococcus sp. SDR]
MPGPILLALDQGTTSTRAIAFDATLTPLATAQVELPQHFPAPGWVEHEPEDIAAHSLAVLRDALAKAGGEARDVAGIGITNQRETTVLWERATGRAVGRAIVWQDRRTAATCEALREAGHEALVSARTGLLLDPYFSATKLAWLLDHTPGARAAAERGELCFGTVESFLLFRLTEGRVHATDATNASRTMLFDIHRGAWDAELCDLLRVPMAILPQVRDCAAPLGETRLLGGAIPILGAAGDQQAATIGQACFAPGMMKSTYGTGCFALLVTGEEAVSSSNRLLTTVAWQLGGKRAYALEGSIFMAGATVQWLRDGLGIIQQASEADGWAARANPAERVHLVPAFTGLGAPWWDAAARGAILGLTRASGRAEICRAALEAVALQTGDLLEAMRRDWPGMKQTVLRVDGGMAKSDWTMQFLADLLGAPVDRPMVTETTALGAAYLAGLQAGLLPSPSEAPTHWRLERRFQPNMSRAEAAERRAAWQDAVRRTRSA